jgi:hypothetical protein
MAVEVGCRMTGCYRTWCYANLTPN